MANPMRYGARCSTQSTSSPLPAPKLEESRAHRQTLRPWSVPPAGDERWKTLSSMVHDAVYAVSSLWLCPSAFSGFTVVVIMLFCLLVVNSFPIWRQILLEAETRDESSVRVPIGW